MDYMHSGANPGKRMETSSLRVALPGEIVPGNGWRSLKQEEVYRRAYETVSEAGKGIADYLRYFNEERPHQGLDNRTPDDVFYKRKPLFKAA